MELTFKYIWDATFKIDKGRKIMYTELFGNGEISGLNKSDAMSITIIVNVFQFFESFGALRAIISI